MNCLGCGRELSTDPGNTTSYRTDGFCTARCKKNTPNRDMLIAMERDRKEAEG